MKATILCLAAGLFSASAYATTELTYWDFLGGGDGVRMKQIVEEFNKSQSDIHVTESTLTWGEPFYTKVHTGVVSGQTPDVMTYHLSHFAAGIQGKDLRPITNEELAQAGMKQSDFQDSIVQRSLELSKKYGDSDQLFGVPLDIHTLVLYYNKTALKKAGLLGPDGKPTGTESIDAFNKMLGEAKAKTHLLPIAASTNTEEPASCWRIWYTFLKQQNGDFIKDGKLSFDDVEKQGAKSLQIIADWMKEGYTPKNTTYPSSVALFSAGRAVFMINGNWEVPTLVDLEKSKKLTFEYGVQAFPKLFEKADTWADSHQLAIPNNQKNPPSPEKVAAALKFIAYVVKQQTWAGGGHIPTYLAVQQSSAYKQMSPNNEYSAQAAQQVSLEPALPIFGVGGPTFAPISSFLVPAWNDQIAADQAIKQFDVELQKFAKQ
ncbi:MAG TPA: extracellular solute-binding protein [Chthoniobacterales bacterium]|nr:extracellular solute-binding protein [Chthoniobacterales bacterium]